MILSTLSVSVLAGPVIPLPLVQTDLLEAMQIVQDTHGRSGFQLTFRVQRQLPGGLMDYEEILSPLLKAGCRVSLVATLHSAPFVLFDGVITRRHLDPGAGLLHVMGEDLGVLMDLESRQEGHVGMPDVAIVGRILATYAVHGVQPVIVPPKLPRPPDVRQPVRIQQSTDLSYLKKLARDAGYLFFLEPGPAPGTTLAYWGPPRRTAPAQPALSIRMGGASNVNSLRFQHDALAPTRVAGAVQDRDSGLSVPVKTYLSTRMPPLATHPGLLGSLARTEVLPPATASAPYAAALAQSRTDLASDQVVTAEGDLDVVRYGVPLRAGYTVGVRGAGYTHDGLYHVDRIIHRVQMSDRSFTQSFSLSREGTGSTTPVVLP